MLQQNDRALSEIEEDLLLPLWWVVATIVLLGLALFFVNELQPTLFDRSVVLLIVLTLLLGSGAIALLGSWRQGAGGGVAVLLLAGLLNAGLLLLPQPGLLALLPLILLVTLLLIGLKAAGLLLIVETVLLLAFDGNAALFASPLTKPLIGLALWLTWAALAALYYPWRAEVKRLWHGYEQAHSLLDEARDRNLVLDQTLDDLLHANRQLDLLNERLAALRLVAEEARSAKAAFVAKVSHEFRTPLNMIIGLTDLLIEIPAVYGQTLPPALLHDLAIVHRNCTHLSSLIDDVLDLSQTEAGRLALHRQSVDLSEDLRSAVTVVEPLLQKKQIQLECCLPATLPPLYCDRKRIRQVILNLLSNAARYTERGRVAVLAEVRSNEVVISVSDTGPGIAAEDMQRIFEPFFQTASAQGRAQEGSGLGLTISQQLVEMHEGRLWVESQPGVGSTFSFSLPISLPSRPTAKAGQWIREEWLWQERLGRPPSPSLPEQRRVVLCDTTGELSHLLAHTEIGQALEVVETHTVEQALAACQACPAHFLLINAALPALWPLVEQARQTVPDTPVLATALPSHIDQILENGAMDYLIKPITRADVVAALELVTEPVRRILLVDDEPEVRALLTRMLLAYDADLAISEAATGEEALHQLRTQRPDLMFLDMMLPEMTGLQLLTRKLQDPALCTIPTVVISAQDPSGQPTTSNLLVVTMGSGLTVEKLMQCAIHTSEILLSTNQMGGL